MKKRILQFLVTVFIFVILLNQLIGLAVTIKPWYERLFITVVSAVAGGGIGGIVGLIIGGIGIALMGTAMGFIGWIAFGLTGFALGALGGSIYTILANPQFYNFNFWKLSLIIVICITTAGTIGFTTTKVYEKLTSWLKKTSDEDN